MRLPTIFDRRAKEFSPEDQELLRLTRKDTSSTASSVICDLNRNEISLEGYRLAVQQALELEHYHSDVVAALSTSNHLKDLSTPDIKIIFSDLVSDPDHTKAAMDIIFKTEGRGTVSRSTVDLFRRFLWEGSPEDIEKAIDIYRDVPHLQESLKISYSLEAVKLIDAGKTEIAEILVDAGLVTNPDGLMPAITKRKTALDSLTATLEQRRAKLVTPAAPDSVP